MLDSDCVAFQVLWSYLEAPQDLPARAACRALQLPRAGALLRAPHLCLEAKAETKALGWARQHICVASLESLRLSQLEKVLCWFAKDTFASKMLSRDI